MNKLFAVCLLAACAAATHAEAHAHLRSAVPAQGSTVSAPPTALSLVFSEGLEPRFSSVVVTDSSGARVDKNDLQTAPGDAKTVTIDVQPLKPGTYHVSWHAVSVDTHKTQGSYSFTVGQ
jgi:methionine-rich copper-binding protein CopC